MKDNGHKGIMELRRDLFGRMSSPLPQRIVGGFRENGVRWVAIWAPAQHTWSREHGFGVTFLPASWSRQGWDRLPANIPIHQPPGTVHSCSRCRPPKKGEDGQDKKADKPEKNKPPTSAK